MATVVAMPETGNLVKWYLSEGDRIKEGDLLCDVETDKTVIGVEAEQEGILRRILVAEGTTGVEADTPLAEIGSLAEAEARNAEAPEQVAEPLQALGPETTDSGLVAASVASASSSARIFSSPLARRLAREKGMSLSELTGTGPGGRIVERDVKAVGAAADRPPVAAFADDSEADFSSPEGIIESRARRKDDFAEIPITGIRRRIAERLTQSKQTIPHFYLSIDVEVSSLAKLRREINDHCRSDAAGEPRYRISLNDFVVKSLALALKEVPAANALWDGERILQSGHSDIGVAIALEEGLIAPVVRDADQKSLSQISNEIRDFATRARTRSLAPAEYQGGTSSVSNLGMYGVKEFSAVINPPQSSILAVGMAADAVIARGKVPVVETMMSMTLSCDHRVIDGAVGAKLLSAVKRLLENPLSLLV